MNQTNQGDNPGAPLSIPAKRKRGRPRKDPSLKPVKIAPAPPGFQGVHGNPPHQIDPVNHAKDVMVGQPVIGVIEAAFDAGYLLTVRVGNSNTSFRGVVFKPGHYLPVTSENDVAPHVEMIRRNEVHLPAEKRGYKRRSKEWTEENGLQVVISKGKYSSPMAAPSVPPVGARGTVVPVLLQPVNFSHGLPPANHAPLDASPAAYMTTSRDKDVQSVTPLAFLPPNASMPINQLLPVASEALPSQHRMSHQVTPETVQNENGLFSREEARSSKLTDMRIPGEVNNNEYSQEMQIENRQTARESSSSSSADARVVPEREIGEMNEHPLINPRQGVRPDQNQSAFVSKPLADKRPGRMTELLLALQENMTRNHVPKIEYMDTET